MPLATTHGDSTLTQGRSLDYERGIVRSFVGGEYRGTPPIFFPSRNVFEPGPFCSFA